MTGEGQDDERLAEQLQRVLRRGNAASKIAARAQLAAIYERRGWLAEATDLVIANIRAGAHDGASFLWLARLHRGQGDARLAARATAEAAKYLPPEQPARDGALWRRLPLSAGWGWPRKLVALPAFAVRRMRGIAAQA